MSFNLGGKLSLDAGDFVRSARQAQTSVEDVDAELNELDGRKIKLEADASDARAEISRLHSELLEVDGMDARAEISANIADAQADLDRVESEIRDIDGRTADIRVDADTSGLDDAIGKLGELPGAFGDVGASLQGMLSGPGGLAAGVAGLGAATFAIAENTANAAIEAQTYADLSGTTVENASRLLTVTKQVGIEATDLSDITLQTVQGLRDNAEYAEKLGINLADGKAPADRLVEVLDKMNTSQLSANEKAEIFGALLGEEGVRQGQQLVTQIGNIERAMADVPDANLFDDDDVREALEFKEQINALKLELAAMGKSVGEIAVPAFTKDRKSVV